MADITVTAGTDYTGTPVDDEFTIDAAVNGSSDDSTVDGADGEDTANFAGLLGTSAGDANFQLTGVGEDDNEGSFTVTSGDGEMTDTYDLSDFESIGFANGMLDLSATPLNQQLLVGSEVMGTATSPSDGVQFDINSVLSFDGSEVSESEQTFTIASVADNETDASDLVQINQGGQTAGRVRIDEESNGFVFTPTQSFINSIDSEEEEVTFDVGFESDGGDTFTETYTVAVAGQTAAVATGGDDTIPGDSDDNGNTAGGVAVERSDFTVGDGETFNTEDADSNGPVDALGGDDFMNGGAGADVLYGNDGNDEIFAGDDDDDEDLFVGGSGDDTIGGGDGNDILTGDDDNRATGVDEFDSTADGSDTIFGGAGNDEIHTGSWSQGEGDLSQDGGTHTGFADDVAYAGSGDDIVRGAGGNDTLGGGNGDDDVGGGAGDDTIYGGADSGTDMINGGEGNDTIFGGGGDDVTIVVDDNDTPDDDSDDTTDRSAGLMGGLDDDTIYNGNGDDIVSGGAGDDTIWGGADDDQLEGGAGDDTFAFISGNGEDTILDFTSGDDMIDLSANDEFSDFDDVAAQLGEVGGNATLFYGEEDSVTVQGVAAADLSEDDFTFA